ncbi:hypothetical protein KC19_3G162900 [Ceratodon purpureus]|uniref:tRNA/rRNA methyltransferase SpoU type domain-containing protein n=1 Tax=Ceratodon purpureus TaxID=3225 RepID=A0A8T0IL87_CERPU|nr:hypothetical protein KC19_3G162900 [Ceratodon purpureus]
MMEEYLRWGKPNCTESLLCKDELRSWEETAQRWTRLVAVSAVSNETQQQIVLLVERCLTEIYQRAYMVPRVAEKTLLLFRCLLKECETWACAEYNAHVSPSSSTNNDDDYCSGSRLTQYVADTLLNTLDVLAQNAKKSTGVFWEYHESSVLRVPFPTEARSQDIERSQGSSVTASAVMQGVLATTTLAEGCIWYCRLRGAADIPEGIINFFWDFAWKVVTTPAAQTEAGAEVQLGSYEALVTVCGAWAATVSPRVVSKPMAQVLEKDPFVALTAATVVENLVVALSTNVQVILRRGLLTKLQCEALACYKWSCLEFLLSIPKTTVTELKGVDSVNQPESSISMSVLHDTLREAIDSLESAGEEWLVPLLCSIRWLMHWDVLLPVDSSEEAQDKSVQIMWSLVQSGWATMAKYSHSRVAFWAAFLSAILHPTVFGNKEMHEAGIHEDDGPLKWLICRLITKGDSTPRAMRLTAIHMSGLWLQFPTTLACYSDQLKILILFGEEVAYKDLDGDARKNQDEAIEDILLRRGYGIEACLSLEVYAHVTIAVMLHLIAQVVETAKKTQDNKTLESEYGAVCGRKLLLDLLTHVVEDSELSKQHNTSRSSETERQKLRAWQILCVLSQYVSGKEIDQVTSLLKVAIESNKLPSVRHYIEAFAIRVFLQFPSHVKKHLVPVLHDHNMRAQALSTYITIAVNVVLYTSSADLRLDHLRQVLPAIFPYMTTNHQSSDAYTQVLVYHIFQRWINGLERISSGPAECVITDHSCIDRLCLQSFATYMEANADCMRLKPSVELYLDTFDPVFATTPQGVFCKQGQDYQSETNDVLIDRVSVAVLHRIFRFLNSSRMETYLRGEFIRPERPSKVPLSRSNVCKEVPGSGSVLKHDEAEQLQSVLSPETLVGSETSTKTRSSGSVDSATWSSDAVSISQKLYPKVRGPFQWLGNNSNSHETKDNSFLEALGLQTHGQRDQLKVRDPQQKLIVIATGQVGSSAFASFARTCEAFETARLVIDDSSKSQDHHNNRSTSTCPLPYEVLDTSLKNYLNWKKKEGFTLLGLGRGASSVQVGSYSFCNRSVLVLGGEYGIPRDIVPMLDALIEVANPDGQHPLDVFVGASIVLWEYTQQHHPPRLEVTPVLTDSDILVDAEVHAKT